MAVSDSAAARAELAAYCVSVLVLCDALDAARADRDRAHAEAVQLTADFWTLSERANELSYQVAAMQPVVDAALARYDQQTRRIAPVGGWGVEGNPPSPALLVVDAVRAYRAGGAA